VIDPMVDLFGDRSNHRFVRLIGFEQSYQALRFLKQGLGLVW